MKKGYTLIELMVSTVILALGSALIYESFFKTLDLSNYCRNYLSIVSWMDEKLWEAQDEIRRTNTIANSAAGGKIEKNKKDFGWGMSYNPEGGIEDLYSVKVFIYWNEGQKQVNISRTVFVKYEREKK